MNILYTERMFNSITFDLIFSIGVKELIIGKCKILKILDSCEHSVNQTSSNISDDSHHRIAEGIIPSFRLNKSFPFVLFAILFTPGYTILLE